MGLGFGIATRIMLRFMRRVNASKDQEVALTVGMAYLAYYLTGLPSLAGGSGA